MKNLLSILLIGLATATFAQEPEVDVDATYFHPAASLYVHGDSTSASNLVVNGLAQFPENGKLLRLKELLDKQQEQEQNQDQQDQNDQNQDQQDQEQNDDRQDQDQNQDQNNDQNQEDQQEQEQNQDQQEEQSQQPQQPPPSAEQMSKDEAQHLLDAMKQEEENKRLQLHPVMGNPVKVDKDW